MKYILVVMLLFVGCESPVVEVSVPSIVVVDLYGNDAIDATVEYRIEGDFDRTFLKVDGNAIDVGMSEGIYSGVFPVGSAERMIVVETKGQTTIKSF